MKQLYIEDVLGKPPGANISLPCWLSARRRSGGICFLNVADATGGMQAVVEQSRVGSARYEQMQRIPVESAIHVYGTLVAHANKPREISVSAIDIIGESKLHVSPQPRSTFDVFDPVHVEQMLSKRHLYLRNPKIMAVLKFRSLLMSEVRRWFEDQRFISIDAPILTPVPLYEDRTALEVEIDKQRVFMTQCVGYYLEAAVHAFERVYNMGPSFRGEESRSPRHLMEYHHIKAEIAFADLEDIIRVVESLIAHVSRTCLEKAPDVFRTLGTTMCLDGMKPPYPRISYEDAVGYLRANGSAIEFGSGLSGVEEQQLSKLYDKPFWVTGIPRNIEPFPYCIDQTDARVARVADLIASNGMGELLGVAEKISDLAMLDERMTEKQKHGDPRYEWIREVHQTGCVPHAAFGMGVERFVRWLLNIPHVRDAIPFPRIFRRNIYP